MRIAVFGASGKIGRLVVQRLLDEGHEVRAYVRNPQKLGITHDRLTVVIGELNDYGQVRQPISGTDAVISALGIPVKRSYESMDALEGHRHILRAMKELGVRRYIGWSTPTVGLPRDSARWSSRSCPSWLAPCSPKGRRSWWRSPMPSGPQVSTGPSSGLGR